MIKSRLPRWIIVVAGGSGTRMGAERPKQFIEISGVPILMHTVSRLYMADQKMKIVLALPPLWQSEWAKLISYHSFEIPHEVADGGSTRSLSVKNALEKVIDSECIIGIHDGVRPFFSMETIDLCFSTAEHFGAAVPTLPVVQSLRKVIGNENKAVDRADYRVVQTPQCFHSEVIRRAYSEYIDKDSTDDATLVEASGHAIALIKGDEMNIKITTQTDLKLAQLLLNGQL